MSAKMDNHLDSYYLSVCFLSFLLPIVFLANYSQLDRVKRIWYLSPMRAAKVQASLRIRAVSPEPPLLAHTSSESWGTFRQKPRSLASLNGWACAVKTCHDGMLEDTNSLDGAQLLNFPLRVVFQSFIMSAFSLIVDPFRQKFIAQS